MKDVLKIIFALNEKEQVKLLWMYQKRLNHKAIAHKKIPLITKKASHFCEACK